MKRGACRPCRQGNPFGRKTKARVVASLQPAPTARKLSDVAGKPGEIVGIGDDSIRIAAQGGCLEVFKLRVDKGDKLSGAAFATTYQIDLGFKLGNVSLPQM